MAGWLIANVLFYPIIQRMIKGVKKPGANQTVEWGKIVGLSLAFIVVSVGIDMAGSPPNFYRRLEVPTYATRREVKNAFKAMSLIYHPDKSDAPDAEEHFMALRHAYDVLLDEKARRVYDRFGKEFMERPDYDIHLQDVTMLALYHLPFYVIIAFLAMAFTSSVRASGARPYIMLLLGGLLFLELYAKHGDLDLLSYVFPYSTIFEKIKMLQHGFPILMQLIIAYVVTVYVDVEQERHELEMACLEEILETMKSAPWYKSPEAIDAENPDTAAERGITRAQRAKRQKHKQRQQAAAIAAANPKAGGVSWGSVIFLIYILMQIYNQIFS